MEVQFLCPQLVIFIGLILGEKVRFLIGLFLFPYKPISKIRESQNNYSVSPWVVKGF
jgi:hypothetical protein